MMWKINFGGVVAEKGAGGQGRRVGEQGGVEGHAGTEVVKGEGFIQHFNVGLRTALNQSDYVSKPLFCL